MKKTFTILLSSIFLLGFISCEKICNKKDKDEDYYYSEDYKTSGATLLGNNLSELTELWSVFFTEGKSKDLHYKLVGEKNNKKDVIWEEGIVLAEGYDVTFIPENGSESYKATFNEKKDIYTVIFPDQEQREVTFVLKEGK
jgi:hypothetical protein